MKETPGEGHVSVIAFEIKGLAIATASAIPADETPLAVGEGEVF